MTFEQLTYFIATVESATFFDAAETLHITQSSLSKQIKKMEEELGTPLWDRSKRRAILTPAGRVFYLEAQKLCKQYHETLLKMKKFKKIITHELHIATLPFLAQYNLTEPIRKFRKLHPETTLKLSEVEEKDLLAGLSEGTFDLAIIRKAMIDTTDYHFKPIAQDTLSVILPTDHLLADHSSLSLEDIKTEGFILMHPYTSIYQMCQDLFQKASIHPNILRTARMESIIGAVQIGEGLSLLPERNFQLFQHQGVIAIPLANAPKLHIGIAYKRNRKLSAIVDEFLK